MKDIEIDQTFTFNGTRFHLWAEVRIDATPLARAVERSKRKTMTKNLMTYIAEALAVVLILLLGVAILSI